MIEVRPTALPRPRVLDSAAAMLHALPQYLAADDVTMETYYYSHQSIGRYSFSTHVFPLPFVLDL